MAKAKYLVLIILLLSLLATTYYVARITITTSSRASTTGSFTGLSSENSYLFASPLSASVTNQEKIRVTAFILNSQGLGMPGLKISLKTNLSITPIQDTTDENGKALFDLSSPQLGTFLVQAQVNSDKLLPQKLTLTFY